MTQVYEGLKQQPRNSPFSSSGNSKETALLSPLPPQIKSDEIQSYSLQFPTLAQSHSISPSLYWKISQHDGYNEMQPKHTSLRPSQLAVKTVFQQHSFLQNYCDFFSDKVSKIHFHYTTLTCSKKIKSKNHFVIFLNKYIRPFLFQIICNLLQKTSQTY